jgi:small-conductance mechanosensitive channel
MGNPAPWHDPHMRRCLAAVVLAGTYGLLDAWLWRADSTFWLANISSGYLLLAFLCGLLTRRSGMAVATFVGALSVPVSLVAFYGSLVHAQKLSTAGAERGFLRYAVPGVLLAGLFGLLGARWASDRAWYGPALLAVALFLEPTAWRHHLGFQPAGSVWYAEQWLGACLGCAVLVHALRRHGRAE